MVGTAVVLFFVMALIGVRVIGAIAMPIVGGAVTLVTRNPRIWWRWGGTVFPFIVGGATYAIGAAYGLSWWVALIVAFLIFVTSYARPVEKYPGQLDDAFGFGAPDSDLLDESDWEPEQTYESESGEHRRDRQYECTACGKGLVTENGLRQHMASKHPDVVA